MFWFIGACILIFLSKNVIAFPVCLPNQSNAITTINYEGALFSIKQQDTALEVFRDRAELTQMVLKEKVEHIALLNNKIDVLQDVVTRLQRKLKEELKEKDDENSQNLRNMEKGYMTVQKRLETEVAEQKNATKLLNADLEAERRESQRVAVAASKTELKMGKQIKALKTKVLEMDQALETAQEKAEKMERLLAARENRIQDLEASFVTMRNSLDVKVEELSEKLLSALSDSERLENERQESLQIATAAVKAAEKREKEMSHKVEVLNREIASAGIKDSTTHSKSEIEKSKASFKKEVRRLEQELVKEKVSSAAQRRTDQQQFEAKLKVDRELHLVDLERLQSKLKENEAQRELKKTGRILRIWNRFLSLIKLRRNDSK
mmetsp:Transcript_27408/g.41493  ORF Transcript_27408/g.41493 Transcript_27408/m.41493 type:complete len:379 (+) Transcript_27408:111-1247(+)